MNLSTYAASLVIVASTGAPWEMSTEDFVFVISLLSDESVTLSREDRADILQFFAEACELAAQVDPRACDAKTIHYCARHAAFRNGWSAEEPSTERTWVLT